VAPHADRPTRAENFVAYAAATLATLVWTASVLPGVRLADPATSDDLAAPMLRGPLLILPALLLLVAGPVTTIITHGVVGLRALLAAGDAFVALFAAAALAGTHTGDPGRWVFAGVLFLIGAVAVRDTVVALRVAQPPVAAYSEDAPEGEAPPARWADLRLAFAILALLTPPSLLARADLERGSLLAPFGYIAVSAFGARFSSGVRGLRITASVLFAMLALHLLISLRYVMSDDATVSGWTWCGWTTLLLATTLLAANVARVVILARSPPPAPEVPPAPPAPSAPAAPA
jgi:hypothetical protein